MKTKPKHPGGGSRPGGQTITKPSLPTAEERAEMRALDAKLDAIVAKLKA